MIDGCVTSASQVCTRTRGVALTAAQRQELVGLLGEIDSMPPCVPEVFQPGDPEYSLGLGTRTWSGHLPRDAAQIPARTQGPCAAPTRLAWWVVQAFGVPGLIAPQGGGAGP